MPKLVITDNEGSRTLGLDKELKAGRLADNDIPLKVPEASRHHCRFFQEQGSWFVEDMGSSNGTLVNGRKVSKFELQDGDLIAVGAVTLRFLDSAPTAEEKGEAAAWGEDEISLEEPEAAAPPPEPVRASAPARGAAPAAVEAGPAVVEREATRLVDTESAFADPTFALHEIQEKKSPLPTILAVLLLAALAGGLAWLLMNREMLRGKSDDRQGATQFTGSNLVPGRFWSFEAHEASDAVAEDLGGWHKEGIDDAVCGEVTEPVHSGEQAYSIARRGGDKSSPATWVSLSGSAECDISIQTGVVYRLGAQVRAKAGSPAAGVAVTWIDPVAGDEPREISREVVPAAPDQKSWASVTGFVQAPEGASRARVGLVAAGNGEVVFDDVVFEVATAPAGRAVTIKDFRAWLMPAGEIRVFHFARPVSDGIGVWKSGSGEGGLEPPWRDLVPKAGTGDGVSGALRGGGGEVSVTLAAADPVFKSTWRLPAGASHAIVIPLPGGEDVNVTLLDGDRAKRMRTAFQKTPATGVIIGGQGDRVRIKFLGEDGKPFSAPLDVVRDSGRAFVKLDHGDRTSVTFQYETSFDAEMAEARALMTGAEDAARAGRIGEAMGAYELVLAKFPFDETLERAASDKKEALANDGRNRLQAQSRRVDDAKVFRTARLEDALLAELEADAKRYEGTNLAPEFAARRDDLKAERAKTAKEKDDAAAERLYKRARDYHDSKDGRKELTIQFLQVVVDRYPNTEWAQQARALLEQVRSGKAESPPASRPESR